MIYDGVCTNFSWHIIDFNPILMMVTNDEVNSVISEFQKRYVGLILCWSLSGFIHFYMQARISHPSIPITVLVMYYCIMHRIVSGVVII